MTEALPRYWSVRNAKIGREEQPLVIIDNFIADPQSLIDDAAGKRFAPLAPYYPGVRAAAPASYLKPAAGALAEILRSVFGYERGVNLQECFYSLTVTPPEQLAPMQTIPHFDGMGDGKVAILHFLCAPAHGGTAFYRHRRTGFETITNDRFEAYKKTIEKDVAEYGSPERNYFRKSNETFERIAHVDAVFNRAILYRGVNLHAIDIPEDFTFSPNPKKGRLTVNAFVSPN